MIRLLGGVYTGVLLVKVKPSDEKLKKKKKRDEKHNWRRKQCSTVAIIVYLKAYPITSYQSDSVEHHARAMVKSVFISEGNCPGVQFLKLRSNDRNISTQHIPTMLAQHLQAPAKRSQNLNATDRNIVGRNMLHPFSHHVATSCDML